MDDMLRSPVAIDIQDHQEAVMRDTVDATNTHSLMPIIEGVRPTLLVHDAPDGRIPGGGGPLVYRC